MTLTTTIKSSVTTIIMILIICNNNNDNDNNDNLFTKHKYHFISVAKISGYNSTDYVRQITHQHLTKILTGLSWKVDGWITSITSIPICPLLSNKRSL